MSPMASPLRPFALSANLPTLLPDEPFESDCNTVLRSRRELIELQDRIDATVNTGPQMPYAEVELEGGTATGADDELETEEVSALDRHDQG
jgi:hypothetical protein